MKFLAMIFAILAAVPQALRWMANWFANYNGCKLPAEECLIKDNDQSAILNMIYGPTWFTTTGLWVGIAGFVVFFAGMKIQQYLENRKISEMMVKADRKSGVGHAMGQGSPNQPRTDGYGRMPRPPAFDKYGRPRE